MTLAFSHCDGIKLLREMFFEWLLSASVDDYQLFDSFFVAGFNFC